MEAGDFDRDAHPGKPRILFIGWPESSHTHSWIDLLEGSDFNCRLFCLPSTEPPPSWPVKSYVTAPGAGWRETDTRRTVFPPPSGTISHLGYLTAEAKGKGVLKGRSEALVTRTLAALDRVPVKKHPTTIEAALAAVIQAWQPDVIHTLGLDPASFFYMRTRKQFDLKPTGRWVVQARGGPDLDLLPYAPGVRPLIEECLQNCDHFICDNAQNYDNAVRLGLDPRKATEPGLGVVSGAGGMDLDDLRRRWSLMPSQRERVIVWPKAYETYTAKAMPVFEAILKVWDAIQPCRIEMLWMTQPEVQIWYEKFFPEHIKAACPASLRLSREETLDHIARARVMLAPSLSDGIPNTMMEAMALGAAPIVSPLPTITPVVENEVNVLFAHNLYPDEIAQAIVRMMRDDQLVDRLATNNLVRIRELSDRSKIRERAVSYYMQVAQLGREQRAAA